MVIGGKVYFKCYNPWGIDGVGGDSDPNDGTVLVSAEALADGSINGVVVATGFDAGALASLPAVSVPPVIKPAKPEIVLPRVDVDAGMRSQFGFTRIQWLQDLPYAVELWKATKADLSDASLVKSFGTDARPQNLYDGPLSPVTTYWWLQTTDGSVKGMVRVESVDGPSGPVKPPADVWPDPKEDLVGAVVDLQQRFRKAGL